MLQQTPVARVLPVWTDWLQRWPDPAALAAAAPGDAIRHWGRLGYPRRALRLHQAATEITARYDGQVPSSYPDLLALQGIGTYTAAAVASFAFGGRHAVLDTNVRRVLARAVGGQALPGPATTAAETRRAEALLPARDRDVARWNVAVMELGALVCTARTPACDTCPIRRQCAWLALGRPPYAGPARPTQGWQGTDRQVRGRMLAALRATSSPLTGADLAAAAASPSDQAERCRAGLVQDGLVQALSDGTFRLPH